MTTFKKSLFVISILAGLAGCGPNGGDAPSTNDAAACESADAGTAVAVLLGNWAHGTETDTCVCNDGNTISNSTATTAPESFAAGTCPGQIAISNDVGCSLNCQVSGETITCSPGTCQYDGATLQTTSDVYTLANGQVVQETASGVMTLPDGTTCQCTTTNGSFTKAQ